MGRIILSARVGADGVLHVPLGKAEANREVRVTIERAENGKSLQDHRAFLTATAGAWQGEFERPAQGDYETRDPI